MACAMRIEASRASSVGARLRGGGMVGPELAEMAAIGRRRGCAVARRRHARSIGADRGAAAAVLDGAG